MADKNYIRVSYTGPGGVVNKVRLPLGSDDPLKYRMFQLAGFGMSLMQKRISLAIDSADQPMPRLSIRKNSSLNYGGVNLKTEQGYEAWKLKNIGSNKRDLYGPGDRTFLRDNGKIGKQKSGTGHMLDDVHITMADERRAQIAITTLNSRVKAMRNEALIRRKGGSGWWGWSPHNVMDLRAAAEAIFHERVESFRLGFFGLPNVINRAIPPWHAQPGWTQRGGRAVGMTTGVTLRTFGGG